jgi:hypothetical protein
MTGNIKREASRFESRTRRSLSRRAAEVVATGGLSEIARAAEQGIDVASGAQAMRRERREARRAAGREEDRLRREAEEEQSRQRRRREGTLRAALQPQPTLFDVLGERQGRRTLG